MRSGRQKKPPPGRRNALPVLTRLLPSSPAPYAMLRLPKRRLKEVHAFLLEIHGCSEFAELHRLIPGGLNRLIPSDRTSFNELSIDPRTQDIVPNPRPPWWDRLGCVYKEHLLDHPLFGVPVGSVVGLRSGGRDKRWNRSVLNNEYFAPLGFKVQISVMCFQQNLQFAGIACNRSSRKFSAEEVEILRLITPHVSIAIKKCLLFSSLKEMSDAGNGAGQASRTTVVVIDRAKGCFGLVSQEARRILRDAFAIDAEPGTRLPERLLTWLRSQRTGDAGLDFNPGNCTPWLIRRAGNRIEIAVLSLVESETVLALRRTGCKRREPTPTALTDREFEVLRWIREGKRNGEIAAIMGLSGRTVEKHVEHLLMKLGVETRTAAAQAALAYQWMFHV